MTEKHLGSIGQWGAFFLCLTGLYIEIAYGADFGYICITFGSLLLAVFTKIKHERNE